MPRNRQGTGAQGNDALEVFGLIFVVGDLAPKAVNFVLARPPSCGVPLGDDTVDPVGREKTVIDALTQTVLVDRIAEIQIGVAVVFAQRRRRHAKLEGGLEMFKNDAPRTVVARRFPVAFVDNNEVEEIRRVVAEKPGAALVFGKGLIDGEIHFAAFDDFAGINLVACVAEGGEGLVLWVVDKDVAVGQIKDARLAIFTRLVPAARPQLPANLEGHDGFAGSRRHSEKQALLSGKDRLRPSG